jgi:glyoxylase-like metal-dependent hydrolase (beta-lactamase superfamily II)
MRTYQIYPILSSQTNIPNSDFISSYLTYLIRGEDTDIFVDAGPGDREWVKKYHNYTQLTPKDPEENIREGLAAHGLKPEDIKTLIITHLHWDHTHNLNLFPNARFYVQQKEIEFSLDPIPSQYVYYESLQGGYPGPQWMKYATQLEIIDGDYELCDGIKLVTIPGHTPGFQGVLINTTGGRYLIASDTVGTYANWENREYGLPKPSHITSSLIDYYASIRKMLSITNYILPGHDKRVLEHPVYPYPQD